MSVVTEKGWSARGGKFCETRLLTRMLLSSANRNLVA